MSVNAHKCEDHTEYTYEIQDPFVMGGYKEKRAELVHDKANLYKPDPSISTTIYT